MNRKAPDARRGEWAALAVLLALATCFLPLNDGRWVLTEDPLRHALALAAAFAFVLAWWIGARRRARRHRAAQDGAVPDQPGEALPIIYATQTGEAEALAHRTREALREAGVSARALALETVAPATLAALPRALFIASTTGEGDPPDIVAGFAQRVMGGTLPLPNLRYAVLALGDRGYEDYCGFGRRLDEWLRAQGAQPLFPRIEVDDGDPAALETWREALARSIAGQPLAATWRTAPWQNWRLARRVELNPGSLGEPTFHLELTPLSGLMPDWRAGDIAEIRPQHDPDVLAQWFQRTGLDPDGVVSGADGIERLGERLARSQLPDVAAIARLNAQQVADGLVALRPRDYSIASLPDDGHLALLVRQGRCTNGQLGLGGGWLTRHAALRGCIALRLRANPGFHAPDADLPLILIGNGTGMAGLRALLRERMAQGRFENWLLFGERQRLRDAYYADELHAALAAGRLAHLDFAFSRDAVDRRYVQHLLDPHAARLRDWIARGAAIRVCGSLEGMAGGVDAALRRALGDSTVDALLETGRYRRDVY